MPLQEDNETPCCIKAYEHGLLTLADGSQWRKSVIINYNQSLTDWPIATTDDLDSDIWEDILSLKPDVLLLGTGKNFYMPSAKELKPLIDANIGVESMDTAAACRTFVALSAESRKVVAALIINSD